MPELPEIETLRRQLNNILPGEEILQIQILDAKLGEIDGLIGHRVETVKRRGKFLLLCISGGLTSEFHLRMSGRLFWQKAGTLPPSPIRGNKTERLNNSRTAGKASPATAHSRLLIFFPTGTLYLIDPRRFATFTVQPADPPPPLVEDALGGLSVRHLSEVARSRQRPVKSFLMDQRLIAGIGNIYACEILFAAGVHPERPSCSLLPKEWRKVSTMATKILERATACRGTTVSDWRDLFGNSGTNQNHLAVYARQGEPCLRCDGQIARIVQSGRGTWFCPSCQK